MTTGESIAAVVLAASGDVVDRGSGDWLRCLTEFEGRTVLGWWCSWLDSWGINERLIVTRQADRRWHQEREGVDGPIEVSRRVFVGGELSPDPLDQLAAAMASVEADVVLVIDADTLPPPVNPYDLVPTVVDAGCVALGPVRVGWQRGYAIPWTQGAGQVPVGQVIDAPGSAPLSSLLTGSLGVAAVRRLSFLAATDGPDAVGTWVELHARWAASGALSGRFYPVVPPPFSTAVELAAARVEFPAWNADLARARASSQDVEERR